MKVKKIVLKGINGLLWIVVVASCVTTIGENPNRTVTLMENGKEREMKIHDNKFNGLSYIPLAGTLFISLATGYVITYPIREYCQAIDS